MTDRAPSPISPEGLASGLAERVRALPKPAVVLLDGAQATEPTQLAEAVTQTLRAAGQDALHIDSHTFWRDASIRLEYGRHDTDAYLDWLDAQALQREVIAALRAGRAVLPTLRDPDTNRSSRAQPVAAELVIISGELLLRHDLDPDLVIHLAASGAALARRTPAELAWTLPAIARYERECAPSARSDVVVRCDDPRHPAVLGLR